MIPIKLTLEGFLSYLDQTTVDLSSVELACVSGPNGAGKSSLFDAITWALFGKARRSDDALINDAAQSCMVIFEFEYERCVYRVIRQKTRDKSALLELHIRADDQAWKPLTEAGLRTTEMRIREILRLDYDTFINASFFLQGKADMFTQQNPTRRKEILGSILGLDAWELYREEAAARRRNIANQVKGLQTWLDEILEELGQEDQRREKLSLLQQNLEKTDLLRQQKENQLAVALNKQQEVAYDNEKLSMMKSQIEAAAKRLENTLELIHSRRAEEDSNQELLSQSQEIEKSHLEWRRLQKDLEDLNLLSNQFHQLQIKKSAIEAVIHTEQVRLKQELQHLIKEESENNQIKEKLPAVQSDLEALEREQFELSEKSAALQQFEQDLIDQQNTRAELQADNNRLKTHMNEINQHMRELQSALGSQCPLCGQNLSDQHREEMVVQLKQEGTASGDRYRENAHQITALETQISDLNTQISELRKMVSEANTRQQKMEFLSRQVDEMQVRLTRWEESGHAQLLKVNRELEENAFSVDERKTLTTILQSIQGMNYDAVKHEHIRQKEAAMRVYEQKYLHLQNARITQEGLQRELVTLDQTRMSIDAELAAQTRQHDDLQKQINAKQQEIPDLSVLESELNSLRQEENQLRRETGAAQQSVQVLEALRSRQAGLTEQIEGYNRQIAQLKILEAAFSKDGVPALLIEQALPEIESQANTVLDRLSNGRMSVSFETEREYKDKRREDKKPTLDIIISDLVGSREYELFSGGEAFRINFAIRLALSRVLAGRAGARLQTLVIDEGFGSQDVEGRQRLVEAINLIRPDFEKILIITHLDELKDAFPSRIEVQKNERGSLVEVIA